MRPRRWYDPPEGAYWFQWVLAWGTLAVILMGTAAVLVAILR